ncbi:hypothetical protein pb186bvf_017580 [Paramecium bursaria]
MSGININIQIQQKGVQRHPQRPQIPWGLNQERLRNYLLQELLKDESRQNKQQEIKHKAKNNRREELGVSFLNTLPKKKIQKLKKKQVEITQENHSKLIDQKKQEEIRMYMIWKQKQIEMMEHRKKLENFEKQIRIQQNLQSLEEVIKCKHNLISQGRNRTASISMQKKKKKKSKKKVAKQDLKDKFKNIAARFANLQNSDSCINMIESDQDPDPVNDSKYSNMLYNIQEPELDEDDQRYINEIGSIEKQMSGIVKAVITIQKVWRGYKIRQILKFYKDYLSENLTEIKEDVSGTSFKFNSIDPINFSAQQCPEPSDQYSSNKQVQKGLIDDWEQDISMIKRSSLKSQVASRQTPQKLSKQIQTSSNTNSHFNSTKFLEEQKVKWQNMLEYISTLQRKGSKQNLNEVLQDIKKLTQKYAQEVSPGKKQLYIQINDQIEESVEISEMRQAFGSEQILKLSQTSSPRPDASIFEQTPFLDFTQKKFKELLNRDNMNQLIQMREQALEERKKGQQKLIQDAFAQKQISPQTYQLQQQKLEKWATKEKQDLLRDKQIIEKGWKGSYDTFMRTQRDIMFLQKANNQPLMYSFSSETISNKAKLPINTFQTESNKKLFTQHESGTMFLSSSVYESHEIKKAPCSSPSPSPKLNNHINFPHYESVEWDDDMLYNSENLDIRKLGQSQMIKVSTLVQKQPSLNDQQAQSYSILILNSIIGQEIQDMYEELNDKGIDIAHLYLQSIKPQKGIKTGLQYVKNYLDVLKEFALQEDQLNIIRKINIPIGPSPKEMLKLLRYYEQEDQSIDDQFIFQAILSQEIYANLERRLMEDQSISTNDEFLLELEHFHNKIIFDALNEALDYYRPYGLGCYPFPWKTQPQSLQQRLIMEDKIENILIKGVIKVSEWAQSLVGIIIDKEDSPFPKILQLDQEYLNQIKEDRMIRMLNAEVIEQEQGWLNYDEQYTEINVEISQMIFDDLIQEFCNEQF